MTRKLAPRVTFAALAAFNGLAVAYLAASASEFWHVIDGDRPAIALLYPNSITCLEHVLPVRQWHSACAGIFATLIAGTILTPLLLRRTRAIRPAIGALRAGVVYAVGTVCLGMALILPILAMTPEGSGMSPSLVGQGTIIWGALGGFVFSVVFAPYLVLGGWFLALLNRKLLIRPGRVSGPTGK